MYIVVFCVSLKWYGAWKLTLCSSFWGCVHVAVLHSTCFHRILLLQPLWRRPLTVFILLLQMNVLSHAPWWTWARISLGTYYLCYMLRWLHSCFAKHCHILSKMTARWMHSAAVHVPASLPSTESSDFLVHLMCTVWYGVESECVWQPDACVSSCSYWSSGFPLPESVSPPWTLSPCDFRNNAPTTSLATSQPPLLVPALLPSLLMLEEPRARTLELLSICRPWRSPLRLLALQVTSRTQTCASSRTLSPEF